jgi:Flp pilus assembly protein TadG
MRSDPRSHGSDSGMITAELAAALPVLMMIVAVALSAVTVTDVRVRAQDAAREAARAYARGDPAAARRLAQDALPGADVTVGGADVVTAVVTIRVRPIARWLPAVTVREHAAAAREP